MSDPVSYGTLAYRDDAAAIHQHRGDGPFWELVAQPQVMIKAKRMFPRARQNRTGALTLTDTPEIARDLSDMLLSRYSIEVDAASKKRLRARTRQHVETEQAVSAILAGGERARLPAAALEPTVEPWEAQRIAAALAHRTRRLLLLDETGGGKTLSACLAMVTPETLPGVVVGPPHLLLQWKREIARFYPMLRVHLVTSGAYYDPASKRDMAGHEPDVVLITYMMLRGWADHLAPWARTVVFEEVHELRRGDSQKYDAACVLSEAAELRIGVTATPVFNYGDEIHNIVEAISPDTLGSRDEFLREWCIFIGNGKYKVTDPKALGSYLRAEGVTLKRTLKEMGIDLPGVRPILHAIDVDTKKLDTLTSEAVSMAQTIVSRDAKPFDLMRATRDFDAAMRLATGVAKAPHVATFCEMLLDSVDKLILFGWHRAVYDIWLAQLAEFNPVLYTGSESPSLKEIHKARFLGGDAIDEARRKAVTNRGHAAAYDLDWTESRLLIISLRSGAGMDGIQHVCHTAVQGELDWSYGPHHQGVGRLDRPGQEHPVLNYWLVSDHGTDPGMLETIDIKRQQADGIVDPDRDVFEPTEADPDRIKKLAANFLAKRGGTASRTEPGPELALELEAAA